ncbi:uncharacterized protein LOC113762557 [Coffea eugenioides]|uniref:Uncharacterized protein isoform X2 n=1 Tax=Coffea arabica TaxID=13443 RepID=A0A6P6VLW3_COFAR|nr:uncharacterized protein LOC113762557 [Coffea eugenioides]
MAKFNVVQKQRRAAIAERKRAVQGDPLTKKLKHKHPPLSISGKRKRKLFKKWRRDQKAAAAALTTAMQDVEMLAVAHNDDNGSGGTSQDDANKQAAPKKFHFHMKKSPKYKAGRFKKRDRNRKSDKRAAQASKDAMEE